MNTFLAIYTIATLGADGMFDRWWQASLQFPTEQDCVEASKAINGWATSPDLHYTPDSRIISTDCSDTPFPPMYQKREPLKFSLTPPDLPVEGPFLTFYSAAVEGYEAAGNPYAGITIKFPTELACKEMSEAFNALANGIDIKYVPGSVPYTTRCKDKAP